MISPTQKPQNAYVPVNRGRCQLILHHGQQEEAHGPDDLLTDWDIGIKPCPHFRPAYHDYTKTGDRSFHAYAAAVNAANEFGSQALDILELIPFNNLLADLQEEHMPSYPPMSPVTSALFASWLVLDARDPTTGLTLGEMLLHYLHQMDKFDYLEKAMVALNVSYCSFYEVTDLTVHGLTLRDIAGKSEVQCWNASGYPGINGEIWYVRLLSPFVEGSNRSVTMGTPYVFRDGDRHTWESFFQRYLSSEFGAGHSLRDYLKYGKSLGCWLEFVF